VTLLGLSRYGDTQVVEVAREHGAERAMIRNVSAIEGEIPLQKNLGTFEATTTSATMPAYGGLTRKVAVRLIPQTVELN
jgi:hypothetical protein